GAAALVARLPGPGRLEFAAGACGLLRAAGDPRRLGRGLQAHADRVHAVALVRRGVVALALEHVAQVRAAVGAEDLGAGPAQGVVRAVLHPVLGQRGVEGRPPAVALELRLAPEQLTAAGSAGVDALGLGVGVLTDERTLRAGLAKHGVLLRSELLTPLLVGLGDSVGLVLAHSLITLRPLQTIRHTVFSGVFRWDWRTPTRSVALLVGTTRSGRSMSCTRKATSPQL